MDRRPLFYLKKKKFSPKFDDDAYTIRIIHVIRSPHNAKALAYHHHDDDSRYEKKNNNEREREGGRV